MFTPILSLLVFATTVSYATPSPFSSNSRALVVGGIEAAPKEFPWMVGLRKNSHSCGASILSSEWIVTAAHCSQALPSTYTLVAGDHDNAQEDGTEQRRNVLQILNHPNYSAGTNQNDISMIQVTPPFEFNEFVQPIQIAPKGYTLSNNPPEMLTVAGWGMLHEDGEYPTTLMKVTVPFVNDEKCREFYGENRIKDAMLCAGEEGKDACTADSGGPLTKMEKDGQFTLVGIVAFGTGCARPDKPGVYSEVSYYQDWIQSVLNESQKL